LCGKDFRAVHHGDITDGLPIGTVTEHGPGCGDSASRARPTASAVDGRQIGSGVGTARGTGTLTRWMSTHATIVSGVSPPPRHQLWLSNLPALFVCRIAGVTLLGAVNRLTVSRSRIVTGRRRVPGNIAGADQMQPLSRIQIIPAFGLFDLSDNPVLIL